MTQLPTITNYGQYSNDNYGAHTLKVGLGTISLFYSYDTIVAYSDSDDGLTVCENIWSTTTGKHLNWIDGGRKDRRKDSATFDAMLSAALARHIQ